MEDLQQVKNKKKLRRLLPDKVPHTVWPDFDEKCDSEHPTTQQKSEENRQLSAVHQDNFATQATLLGQRCGEKSEARAKKNMKN